MSNESTKPQRRALQIECEVPGAPDQVWQAIATGPGISSWLFPTQVEERAGGAIEFDMGSGMKSSGTVTVWQPPQRFCYEEPGWAENAPPLVTEFVIEPQSGGTCRVRLVSSLSTSKDEWDHHLEGMKKGWPPYFAVLRLYLSYFAGQPSAPIRLLQTTDAAEAEIWQRMIHALGVAGSGVGQPLRVDESGGPSLTGTIESLGERELIARVEGPLPGIVLMNVGTWEGRVHAAVGFYCYGEHAAALAARHEPEWARWLEQLVASR